MNSVKFFIPFIIIIVIAIFLGINKKKISNTEQIEVTQNSVAQDSVVPQDTTYINYWLLDEIISEDYDYAKTNFDKFVYYQIDIRLNDSINSNKSFKDYTCSEVISTIQTNMKCIYIIHNLENNFHDISVKDSLYIGAFPLNKTTFAISLNEAIKILKESVIDLPNTDIVIIKIPISKKYYSNPLYIFKDDNFIYGIDTMTGILYNMK